jgi:RimJ/RimL family protein N-acetyltransferase
MVTFALSDPSINSVIASVNKDNFASSRVLEKVGFHGRETEAGPEYFISRALDALRRDL